MGLLSRLVMLPLAPVEGVVWLAEQLQRQAEAALYGDAALAELQRVTEAYERGELSEEQYALAEMALLERFEASPQWPEKEHVGDGF